MGSLGEQTYPPVWLSRRSERGYVFEEMTRGFWRIWNVKTFSGFLSHFFPLADLDLDLTFFKSLILTSLSPSVGFVGLKDETTTAP